MDQKRIENIFSIIEKNDVDDNFWKYFELTPDDSNRKEFLHNDWLEHVKRLVEFSRPSGKVVSEGIGYGIIEYYMLSVCNDIEEIIGIELDDGKVKSLNNLMRKLGINRLHGICGDARNIDYEDRFDHLTLIDVLEHAYSDPYLTHNNDYKNQFDQKALLQGVSRHLKPGGAMFIFSMNGLNPNMLRWSKKIKKEGIIENPVNPYQITKILEEMNYSDFIMKPYARNWNKRSGWKRSVGDIIEKYTPFRLFTTPTFMLKAKKNL